MSSKPTRLAILGVGASQPYRSVTWLCEWKGIPFESVKVQPGKDTQTVEYKNQFLGGTVPALIDRETDLQLFEMNAIMVYICREFGLDDVLPRNPGEEAKIHQWLNWHHGNTRMFSKYAFAPFVRPDLGFSMVLSKGASKHLEKISGVMEKQLSQTPFLVGNTPTLADLCCYEEVGQCVHLDLYDFGKFPKLRNWMKTMETIEGFDQVHSKVFQGLKIFIDKVKADTQKAKSAL